MPGYALKGIYLENLVYLTSSLTKDAKAMVTEIQLCLIFEDLRNFVSSRYIFHIVTQNQVPSANVVKHVK